MSEMCLAEEYSGFTFPVIVGSYRIIGDGSRKSEGQFRVGGACRIGFATAMAA